jgi:hypothetical protein
MQTAWAACGGEFLPVVVVVVVSPTETCACAGSRWGLRSSSPEQHVPLRSNTKLSSSAASCPCPRTRASCGSRSARATRSSCGSATSPRPSGASNGFSDGRSRSPSTPCSRPCAPRSRSDARCCALSFVCLLSFSVVTMPVWPVHRRQKIPLYGLVSFLSVASLPWHSVTPKNNDLCEPSPTHAHIYLST